MGAKMKSYDEETLNKFKAEKVMTVKQIARSLNKSIPTARNRLKQWQTITSYNKNGCYYVLANYIKFNSQGLWSYKGIHFSKYGNLKNTLTHVIENSILGLDGIAIGKLLGLESRSFLSHVWKLSNIRREKISGRFIYFSSDEILYQKQLKAFLSQAQNKEEDSLTDDIAIVVLVAKINYPTLSIEKLAKHIQNKGIAITSQKIHHFFLAHGIEKKTLDLSL
jgi:hypothetical protein